jgi:hypothetical protein
VRRQVRLDLPSRSDLRFRPRRAARRPPVRWAASSGGNGAREAPQRDGQREGRGIARPTSRRRAVREARARARSRGRGCARRRRAHPPGSPSRRLHRPLARSFAPEPQLGRRRGTRRAHTRRAASFVAVRLCDALVFPCLSSETLEVDAAELLGEGTFSSRDWVIRGGFEHDAITLVVERQRHGSPAMADGCRDRDLASPRDLQAALHDHEGYHERRKLGPGNG